MMRTMLSAASFHVGMAVFLLGESVTPQPAYNHDYIEHRPLTMENKC